MLSDEALKMTISYIITGNQVVDETCFKRVRVCTNISTILFLFVSLQSIFLITTNYCRRGGRWFVCVCKEFHFCSAQLGLFSSFLQHSRVIFKFLFPV